MRVKYYMTDVVIIGSVILKLICTKWVARMCIEFVCLRAGMSGVSCENGNEGMAENFFDTRPRIRYWKRLISAVI
jgi:hypothetical protein